MYHFNYKSIENTFVTIKHIRYNKTYKSYTELAATVEQGILFICYCEIKSQMIYNMHIINRFLLFPLMWNKVKIMFATVEQQGV